MARQITKMAAMDAEYKIVLLGDPGVGKTTWFLQIKHGEFVDTGNVGVSMGMDHLEHRMTIKGREVKVYASTASFVHFNTLSSFPSQAYLHDTGGGERFRTLTSNFYRNADAAILMYSVEDRYTFENLQEWIESASDVVDLECFVFALVGNKSDMPLEVEHESIKARCDNLATQLSFFTSAKTGNNVIPAFEKIIEHVHTVKNGRSSTANAHKTIDITDPSSHPPKKSCCKTM